MFDYFYVTVLWPGDIIKYIWPDYSLITLSAFIRINWIDMNYDLLSRLFQFSFGVYCKPQLKK